MLNWSYIAGFFDGEGCICVPHSPVTVRGGIFISMVQTKYEGSLLIASIANFLQSNSIGCAVKHGITPSNPKWASSHRVDITNWEDGVRFLSFVLPYLTIKKTQAQDTIRYHKIYPYLPRKIVSFLRDESRTPRVVCKFGHPLDGNNLYLYKGRHKICRTCNRLKAARFRQCSI